MHRTMCAYVVVDMLLLWLWRPGHVGFVEMKWMAAAVHPDLDTKWLSMERIQHELAAVLGSEAVLSQPALQARVHCVLRRQGGHSAGREWPSGYAPGIYSSGHASAPLSARL